MTLFFPDLWWNAMVARRHWSAHNSKAKNAVLENRAVALETEMKMRRVDALWA